MAHLYVANLTKQHQDFIYLIPERKTPLVQTIRIGGQERIYDDAPTEVLNAIVAQHERYGLIPVEKIDQARQFTGLCYSIGKPINIEKIRRGVENNDSAMDAMGEKMRREVAVVASQKAEEAGNVLSFETEVVVEKRRGESGALASEKIEVIPEGASPRRSRRN